MGEGEGGAVRNIALIEREGGERRAQKASVARQCYDNLFLGYKLFTRSTSCNPSCLVKLVQALTLYVDGIIRNTFFFIPLHSTLFTKPPARYKVSK